MVNTWHAVSGWRSLIENKVFAFFSGFKTFPENIMFFPKPTDVFAGLGKIKIAVFGVSGAHFLFGILLAH
jgi:hypothetical protein